MITTPWMLTDLMDAMTLWVEGPGSLDSALQRTNPTVGVSSSLLADRSTQVEALRPMAVASSTTLVVLVVGVVVGEHRDDVGEHRDDVGEHRGDVADDHGEHGRSGAIHRIADSSRKLSEDKKRAGAVQTPALNALSTFCEVSSCY